MAAALSTEPGGGRWGVGDCEDGVGDAQLGHFPVVMIIRDGGGERAVEAKDLEEFVVSASTILDGLDLMMPALTKGAE